MWMGLDDSSESGRPQLVTKHMLHVIRVNEHTQYTRMASPRPRRINIALHCMIDMSVHWNVGSQMTILYYDKNSIARAISPLALTNAR